MQNRLHGYLSTCILLEGIHLQKDFLDIPVNYSVFLVFFVFLIIDSLKNT